MRLALDKRDPLLEAGAFEVESGVMREIQEYAHERDDRGSNLLHEACLSH
jgi:hypothetical protein